MINLAVGPIIGPIVLEQTANPFPPTGTGYLNCEYRKLEFTPDSSEEQATLVEYGSQLEKQARPVGLDSHLFLEIELVEKTG